MTPEFVTPAPWSGSLVHAKYGTDQTYQLAADWLNECATVADWGGAGGYFRRFLPPAVRYTVVDGTTQGANQILADLTTYHGSSDGILIRHVLELCGDAWRLVIANALQAARQRVVVVTYTPAAERTALVKQKSGWPVWHFNPAEMREALGFGLKYDVTLETSHPERVYFCETGP